MADDKIVRLDAYRVQRGGDDAGFLACPVCGKGDFAVVCRGTLTRPFVAALVCIECEPPTELGVLDGYLSAPEAARDA
jgi:hypothetical protein